LCEEQFVQAEGKGFYKPQLELKADLSGYSMTQTRLWLHLLYLEVQLRTNFFCHLDKSKTTFIL